MPASTPSCQEAKKCQTELHKWCKANQVWFDPAKEFVPRRVDSFTTTRRLN